MNSIMSHLPAVRGRYSENVDLSRITWFRSGGCAAVVYKPADADDLSFFLSHCPADIPRKVLGVGSNVLVRDSGVPGVVIRLGSPFAHIFHDGETIDVGAGYLDRNLATFASQKGLGGLEFFAGIPGTVGGALAMNAGCYGGEVKDVLVHAIVMDPHGKKHVLTPADLKYAYRSCGLPKDWIFLGARFKCRIETPAIVQKRMDDIMTAREEAQPIRARTGGSTFKNPEGHSAWKLIDEAGCRGLREGGAQVSEKHCNFLINVAEATSADLEDLATIVHERVLRQTGIDLQWEIERWGTAKKKAERAFKSAA